VNKVYFGINGQFGDIVMQEPALRSFIEDNPETKIVLGCSKRYEEILPLFENYHENIIEFHAWEGYDDWPTKTDQEYIEEQKFDAMFPDKIPIHDQADWAKYRHATTETGLMLGVNAKTTNISLKIPSGVVVEPNSVAVHLFSSKWPQGLRSIELKKQKLIVSYLRHRGLKVYQLSGPGQPHLEGTILSEKPNYYNSCKIMLSTQFLVTCDSGMPWVASAYDHPTIGLYSSAYNTAVGTTKNWQPLNPNAVYLEAPSANQISIYDIVHQIDKKLDELSK
tara:strand:- start:5049 stop:5885 length:837 start_codon:yes stop_codon:yes gene_type:complete